MKHAIRENWEILYSLLGDLKESLIIEDGTFTPVSDLKNCLFLVEKLSDLIKSQSLYKIGNLNLSNSVKIISNRIQGVIYAIETENKSIKKMQSILESTRDIIDKIVLEVSNKIDRNTLRTFINKHKKKNIDISATETFKNFPDAMKEIMKKSEDYNEVQNIDSSSSRDLLHMSKVIEKNTNDLAVLKSEIENIPKQSRYTLVKGPIITDANFQPDKLHEAGIDFDIVYFPGIRFNHVRKESTPRMFILRKQYLMAIVMKPLEFTFKKENQKIENKHKEDDLLFDKITSKIKFSTFHQEKDAFDWIGKETKTYILSKDFPGIRFIWLMQKYKQEKLGNISLSNQLGLPF